MTDEFRTGLTLRDAHIVHRECLFVCSRDKATSIQIPRNLRCRNIYSLTDGPRRVRRLRTDCIAILQSLPGPPLLGQVVSLLDTTPWNWFR